MVSFLILVECPQLFVIHLNLTSVFQNRLSLSQAIIYLSSLLFYLSVSSSVNWIKLLFLLFLCALLPDGFSCSFIARRLCRSHFTWKVGIVIYILCCQLHVRCHQMLYNDECNQSPLDYSVFIIYNTQQV